MPTTDDLLIQMRRDTGPVKGRCNFRAWLDQLPDKTLRAAITMAVDDPLISIGAVQRLADSFGAPNGKHHLQKKCACWKPSQ